MPQFNSKNNIIKGVQNHSKTDPNIPKFQLMNVYQNRVNSEQFTQEFPNEF